MEYFTGRVYKIQIKVDFKKSANMLSLKQKEYIDSIYVGSTKYNLHKRFSEHKNRLNSSSRHLFKLFNINNIEIVLIKEYNFVDSNRLHAYETLYINKCRYIKQKILNDQLPFGISKYYNIDYQMKVGKTKGYKLKNQQKSKKRALNRLKDKEKLICEFCSMIFYTKISLKEHQEFENHKVEKNLSVNKKYTYNCDHCNINSDDKAIFAKHIKSKEHLELKLTEVEEEKIYKFRFECIPCNFKDDSSKDYKTHLESKNHREIFNILDKYKFKCEPCKYYQNQEKLFKRHLKTKSHKELTDTYCKLCNFTSNENINMKDHVKTSSHKLSILKQTKPEATIKDLYTYVCNTCSTYSNDRIKFSNHLKSEDHILNISESKEIIDFEFKYTCDKCNFHTEEKKSYTAHINSKSHKQKN